MSRTRKDAQKSRNTVLEVVKVGEDAFDLLVNHEVYRSNAPLDALPEWLCVRYGYCGHEYDAIIEELERNGRKAIEL
jgi:FMN phosphatase YigB (HAD superfamily)